ncbi:unnamed protein product, partial [Brassica napus]
RKYENAPGPFRLSSPHQTSSTSRDTADPKTYTTATDQHGKENQPGLLNTTESFPLSPSVETIYNMTMRKQNKNK